MALTSAKKAFIRHLVATHTEKMGSCLTDKAWAELHDIHFVTVSNWKTDPEFKAAFEKALEQYENSADYTKLMMRHRALEELWKNYVKSKKADPKEARHYLDMILKQTEDAKDEGQESDYSEMSDEDLASLCLKRDVSVFGMTESELKRLAKKGESCSTSSAEESPSPSEDSVATSSVPKPPSPPKKPTPPRTRKGGKGATPSGHRAEKPPLPWTTNLLLPSS